MDDIDVLLGDLNDQLLDISLLYHCVAEIKVSDLWMLAKVLDNGCVVADPVAMEVKGALCVFHLQSGDGWLDLLIDAFVVCLFNQEMLDGS